MAVASSSVRRCILRSMLRKPLLRLGVRLCFRPSSSMKDGCSVRISCKEERAHQVMAERNVERRNGSKHLIETARYKHGSEERWFTQTEMTCCVLRK